jgi:hypothetical protein
MQTLGGLILLSGLYPLWRVWQANRSTSLLQTVNWALLAWTGWVCAFLAAGTWPEPAVAMLRYLALCLTSCAGVAVLGARRPGLGAWNFVLLGLLAVLLLPLAEGLTLRGNDLQLDVPRKVFLVATLAVSMLNYLPTRLAVAAGLVLAGGTVEVLMLGHADDLIGRMSPLVQVGRVMLALVPWVAWAGWAGGRPPPSEFDRLWLGFRDRFGFFWGQRLREQFNRSAAHAGWPVHLRWRGLRLLAGTALPDPATQAEILLTLRALLKRFGPEEVPPAQPGK